MQKAEADLAAARAAEREARGEWMAGYRRLHAQLTDRFPRDKSRVDHYFRGPPAPRAKKAKVIEMPQSKPPPTAQA